MAKQIGPVKIEGTVGNVTFYQLDGEYCARLKSSLSGKRVKKDPCFRRTMEYAGWLKQASGLASSCYRALPKEERAHAMYRQMVGMAMQMLKAGKDAEVIAVCLEMMFRSEDVMVAEEAMYVDNTGRLASGIFGNNLITSPPLVFPEIPETHQKTRGIHPVIFHTYIRRRRFFHGTEYH